MASAAVYFDDLSVTSRVLAIVLFIILTSPVGAHLIGRASYFSGNKMWGKSITDELEGKYQPNSHRLSSGEEFEDEEEDKTEQKKSDLL